MTAWSDLVGAIGRASSVLDEARERLAAVRGTAEESAARAAVEAAEAALHDAEDAYAVYAGPRPWRLYCEDDRSEIELEECTLGEAREEAREWVQDGSWDVGSSTLWVTVQIRDPHDDEAVETVEVPIDPEEPPCARCRDEHDWVRPHEIVGGCKDNPGVIACGAGVRSREVCLHCKRIRIEDTSEGRREISYDRERDLGTHHAMLEYLEERAIVIGPAEVADMLGAELDECDEDVIRDAIDAIADCVEDELGGRDMRWVRVVRQYDGEDHHGPDAPLEVLEPVRARAGEIRERLGL